MNINHICGASVTEIILKLRNKDNLQPLFETRDSPYIDVAHRKYQTMPYRDYQVLVEEISDNKIKEIVRKTSHRMSRSTSLRTYPNRVNYVASNKGKMARKLFIF